MKLLLLILFFAGTALLSGNNLCQDSTFSETPVSHPPRFPWTMQVTGGGSAVIVSGGWKSDRCLKLSANSDAGHVTIRQLIAEGNLADLPAKARLKFSIAVKALKTGRFFMTVPGSHHPPEYLLAPGAWRRIEMEIQPSEKKTKVFSLNFGLNGPGEILVDEIFFGSSEDAPCQPEADYTGNRIVNGDFAARGGNPALHGWYPLHGKIPEEEYKIITSDRMLPPGADSSCRLTYTGSAEGIGLKAHQQGRFVMVYQIRTPEMLTGCSGRRMELSLQAFTDNDPTIQFRMFITTDKPHHYFGKVMSVYQGWEHKKLEFTMPDPLPQRVNVWIQLLSPGSLQITDIQLKHASGKQSPALSDKARADADYCRVSNFPPRHTYLLPQRPRKLHLDCRLPVPEVEVELYSLDQSRSLRRFRCTSDHPVIDLGDALPAGDYKLIYRSGQGAAALLDADLFKILEKRPSKGSWLDSKGRYHLNGRPFFPIAVMDQRLSLPALKIYSKGGFNTVVFNGLTSNEEIAASLSEVMKKYDMAVMTNLGIYRLAPNRPQKEFDQAVLKKLPLAEKYHKFIGWFEDEVAWRRYPIASVRKEYEALWHHASQYFIWQNHAPRISGNPLDERTSPASIRRFIRASDINGMDVYPVPNSPTYPDINIVGGFAERLNRYSWKSRPLWVILQGYSRNQSRRRPPDQDFPYPSKKELRFMSWNAILHGATGIFLYSEGGGLDPYSDFSVTAREVMSEIHRLSDFLHSGHRQEIGVRASLPRQRFLLPGTISDRSYDAGVSAACWTLGKEKLLVVANELRKPQKVTLSAAELCGYQSPTGQTMTLPANPVISLQGYEVMILSTRSGTPPLIERIPPVPETVPRLPGFHFHQKIIDGEWVIHPELKQGKSRQIARHEFTLTAPIPKGGMLYITADDQWEAVLNGHSLGSGTQHTIVTAIPVDKYLKEGRNILEIRLYNWGYVGGLLYEISTPQQGKIIASGEQTRFSRPGESKFTAPAILGKPPISPWGYPPLLRILTEGVAE